MQMIADQHEKANSGQSQIRDSWWTAPSDMRFI